MSKKTITGKTCLICMADIENGEFICLHETKRQKHILCLYCGDKYISDYLQEIIDTKKYKTITTLKDIKIKCPGNPYGQVRNQCSKFFCPSEKHIVYISLKNSSEHIITLLCLINKEYELCENKKCKSLQYHNSNDDHFTCSICNYTKCIRCNVSPYHKGISCYDNRMKELNGPGYKELSILIKRKIIQCCPKCGMCINKTEDTCNKVICNECHTKFCWLCGAKDIDYDHFNSQMSTKCAGKLFDISTN